MRWNTVRARRNLSAFVALVLAAGIGACAAPLRSSRSPQKLIKAVSVAELHRDGNARALLWAGQAQQREVRLAAMRALARIESPATASIAISLLGDRDEEVAAWASFAAGQIPGTTEALIESLGTVATTPDQVLMALGRSATASAADSIATMLKDQRPKVQGAAALALGMLSKRQPKDKPLDAERFAKLLAPLVKAPERSVRFGAVYGLSRMPGRSTAIALIHALDDQDPEIRANAVRGLGLSKSAPQVFDRVLADPDWRVRLEVVRSLGLIGASAREMVPAVQVRLSALVGREFARFQKGGVVGSGTALHVLLEIAKVAPRFGPQGRRLLSALEQAPWNTMSLGAETGPDLARLQCAVAFALDRVEGVIRRVRSCGADGVAPWRQTELIVKLLAVAGDGSSTQQLISMTTHPDPKVRGVAIEALAKNTSAPVTEALLRLLGSNDPFMASAAAEILVRPDRATQRSPELVANLSKALELLLQQADASLAVLALDALGALGEKAKSALPKLVALDQDPRPAIRRRAAAARRAIEGRPRTFSGRPTEAPQAPIEGRTKLRLNTVRGEILVELWGDLAPRTVGNIVALARRGFYNGTTFHRVVSDFVAQGGCPRGDGWGGPGYSIHGETSLSPFVRGAMGIATNGRDTGGSQFFLMHSEHPHLVGGYTLFGRVTQGMEVMDALQQDDRIIEVQVVEASQDLGVR